MGVNFVIKVGTGSPLSSPFLFLSLFLPSPALQVGTVISSWKVWGSVASFPNGVWGRAPAELDCGSFWF